MTILYVFFLIMSYVYSITRYIEKTYKKDMIHGSRENIMFPNLRLVSFFFLNLCSRLHLFVKNYSKNSHLFKIITN